MEEEAFEKPLLKRQYHENCPGCKVDQAKELKKDVSFRNLSYIWLAVLCGTLPVASLFPFVYFMVKDFNIAETEEDISTYAGYVGSAMMLGRSLTSILWGMVSDRYGRKPVIIIGIITVVIFNTLFGLSTNIWMAVSMRFLLGSLNGLLGPIKAYATEIFREEEQALGLSTVVAAWGVGLVIGPALGGYLAQPVLKYPHIFPKDSFWDRFPYFLPCLLVSAFAFASAIACIWLPETLHNHKDRIESTKNVEALEVGSSEADKDRIIQRDKSIFRRKQVFRFGQFECSVKEKMAKELLTLDNGTTCTSWNYSGTRLAAGSADGTLSIFDSREPPSSSSLRSTFKSRVLEGNIVKIVWIPPEYGDAVACISADGIVSLWEEVAEDSQSLQWKMCKSFGNSSSKVLDVQFGISLASLKMVAAYSDGNVRVFELSDPLELRNWQLQAEFQNVIESVSSFGKASCLSASISWNPQKGGSQESSFLVGFNSNTPELNSSKVWEFDQAHQRWLPVAELALPEDKGDQVYAVAWAPNIGRPYEIIAVATHKGLAIWHLGLNPDHDGRLPVERVALLSGHEGMVWQMEWDMSGMTLATTGHDGMVRLWQSNLNGVWHQQAAFEPTS